ncbi:MAG: HAD-IC family P-type ATPase [Eubacteriales bacterium]|jgi:cation-transporting ATPase E
MDMQEELRIEQKCSAPDGMRGLTDAEVQERVAQGKTNQIEDHSSQSVSQIIKSNVFTYFNLIFAVIAAMLIAVGAFKGLTFLPVIIANMLIGIAQQLYAKRVLDKLSLLDVTDYTALREGREEKISSGDLVQDDIVLLESGQQIPADGIVVAGGISVNESLLTGEQDEIAKKEGAELRSGSFVVSGRAWMRLMRVGSESYASQLTQKAKQVNEKPADMVRDIERIIRIFGIAIIPVGALLLYQSIGVNGTGLQKAVTSMAGALTGMIPEGMYLLATVALAMSAARLAGKQVLLHDMKSIETLARVDVLCVDKTGTITTGEMSVSAVVAPARDGEEPSPLAKESEAGQLLARYAGTVPDSNSTMRAVRAWSGTGASIPAEEVKPFSSKTKYSQVRTKEHVYCFGAPEYLLGEEELDAEKPFLEQRLEKGERVLALTEDGKAVLFICLKDQIRETAKDTFHYFHDRGVEIKVISGDNPRTVSRIAAAAGIDHADKYVDATSLTTPEMIDEAVRDYTVFGRVKPEQKKEIVEALHRSGRKAAMTGDGVNDILAMKEADCSIAMGAGSDAARQAAQVVLMDSDFSHMQNIVAEGRRDVNNITRSATLFLYKNIFSLLLAVFSIINSFTYPLDSSQVSLISLFNIGIPAFLLTLEDNQQKEEDGFLKNTMLRALPAALTSFFTIAALMQFGLLFDIPSKDISTASTYLLSLIGFMILADITKPLNWYHVAVFIVCAIGVILACTTGFKTLFSIDDISVRAAALCVVFAIAEFTIMRWLTELIAFLRRSPASRVHK